MSAAYPTELVPDADFEARVRAMCKRPGMYVQEPYFQSMVSYLEGFDAANYRGPLMGFHQWLVLKVQGGNNVAWPGHVERQCYSADSPVSDEVATARLGEIVLEFIAYRREHGLTKIFHNYGKWLLRQRWYSGPLRSGP